MAIHVIRTGSLGVNSLIVDVGAKAEKKCFVVDPAACSLSGDEDKILDYLKSKKLLCQAIVLTHSHFDHITGIAQIKEAFPAAKIYLHESEAGELLNPPGPMNKSVLEFFGAPQILTIVEKQPPADVLVKEGDEVFGWKVIHTPGHTPGSICLYNKGENTLISGDTLFDYGGYGRTDMYGGDEATIMKSLDRLRKEIPQGTLVYPGHDSFGFKF
ncbi:MAG: MBL fold metallo-hydrolase [Treponema sp.]|nr:MBL fold metallo-hydrolase [Treponema sp.]